MASHPMSYPPARSSLLSAFCGRLAALWLLLFAWVLLSPVVRGAEPVSISEGARWSLLDSGTVKKAGAELTHEAFPDTDYAIVEERIVCQYAANGTGLEQDEYYGKALTESGRRQARSLRLNYSIPYSRVEVPCIEVIKPDGRIQTVDIAANLKDSIDQSQMEENIYDPNEHVVEVNIPGVEVGDVVHVLTRSYTDRAICEGSYAEQIPLQGRGYIRHMSFELYEPEARPLVWKVLRDEVKGSVSYHQEADGAGWRRHVWEAAQVPRIFEEPNMPPDSDVVQRLLVSTFKDWREVSDWYWRLSLPHLQTMTPALRQTVADLLRGKKTEDERLRSLFNEVSRSIRYMGVTPEKDRPGFEPHDVSLTFEKKYGVCRDKAALLVAFLREAGFKAYPVLISVGSRRDADVPDLSFNHAIAAVERSEGGWILMDPTDENTADLLPGYEADQSFLVCREGGVQLERTPVRPAEENLLEVSSKGSLNEEGTLKAHTRLVMRGAYDNLYRSALVEMQAESMARLMEMLLKRSLHGAVLTGFKLNPTDLQGSNQPITVDLDYEAPRFFIPGEEHSAMAGPYVSQVFSLISEIFSGLTLDERKFAFRSDFTFAVREQFTLELPAALAKQVLLPPTVESLEDGVGFSCAVAQQGRKLVAKRQFTVSRIEFDPAAYQRLRAQITRASDAAGRVCLLGPTRKPTAEAFSRAKPVSFPLSTDLEISHFDRVLEIQDAHRATLHVRQAGRVLTYAGKKAAAEIKVEYNPGWQSVRLVSASVTKADGTRQVLGALETNLMDAAWNGAGPRYTGGKVLVGSLPGLDVGSSYEYEYEVTSTDAPFLGASFPFEFTRRVLGQHLEISYPEGLGVDCFLGREGSRLKHARRVAEGRVVETWDLGKVDLQPNELEQAPAWAVGCCVSYSVGSRGTYAAQLRECLEARARGEAARQARLLGAQMAAAHPGHALEQLQSLRDLVVKSIRLVPVNFTTLRLSELTGSDRVLSEGYAHRADRGILLFSLLEGAGFNPEFVLVSGECAEPLVKSLMESHFLPQEYSSLLLRVQVDGQWFYLNDTDQYAKLGSCGSEDQLALGLSRGDSFVIEVPATYHSREALRVSVLNLQEDSGSLLYRVETLYYGTNYNDARKSIEELTPEERRRYLTNLARQLDPGAEPVGELETDFVAYPGRRCFTVRTRGSLVKTGAWCYFTLPVFSIFDLGEDASLRRLPRLYSGANDNTLDLVVERPVGFARSLLTPPVFQLTAPDGLGRIEMTMKPLGDKALSYHLDCHLRSAVVWPEHHADLERLRAQMDGLGTRFFLFGR